ncbi:MAG TPA: aminotransferase class I/II-fold pyridoxal phosphate-dependent enzyme [Gemmatimonadales bacterium]|nr:aminotransferase class I/II-fold pyridoxal phosphate-dependent enzyme [Gemmatimonadales bacterium]
MTLPFVPFDLERWQSTWEHRVRINLSESGVHPLALDELLALAGTSPDELLRLRAGYGHSDGTPALRAAIAALYPDADPEQVVVTIGSAEANFVVMWSLVGRGDRVSVVTPTYMQSFGLAENFGATVTELPLVEALGWQPDLSRVDAAIPDGTKVVVVTNPNNPTGQVLSVEAREAILARASKVGAWILADEVYRGAEHAGPRTESLWGAYERVIVVGGLSKAYGLPGLRIGWILGSRAFRDAAVERHDYTVIGPGPITDWLAVKGLGVGDQILKRTRGILTENYPVLSNWLDGFNGTFRWTRPQCGAICFVHYDFPIPSDDLVERVRKDHGILLVPGSQFQREHYLRLGFGNERAELEEALGVLKPAFERIIGAGSRG